MFVATSRQCYGCDNRWAVITLAADAQYAIHPVGFCRVCAQRYTGNSQKETVKIRTRVIAEPRKR